MKYLYISLILIFSTSVNAGVGGGKILRVYAHSTDDGNGVFMFRTATNLDKASCSTASEGKEWAISLANEEGKAFMSVILSAHAQKLNVEVRGTNACGSWPDREEPKYIYVD